MITMLDPFRCLLTAPTWKKMLTLLRGPLLARGRHTVTAALWHTGHEQDPHFSAFHQALNRACWSPLQASQHLLRLIIETFVQAGGTPDSVIDETLERRWGRRSTNEGLGNILADRRATAMISAFHGFTTPLHNQ